MADKRPTVADLMALKGKRQLSMLRVWSLEEAEAAEKAGIDLLSVDPDLLEAPGFRDAAPTCFVFAGMEHGRFITEEDYLRAAFRFRAASADAVYCAARPETIRRLTDEGVPVCGHCGLIPSRMTWTGGFRAVGKTTQTALFVWKQVRALEAAGAFSAEIEVVPEKVATAISARTGMLMISMGAGPGCDGQYLFVEDVLGYNRGHYPRHSKTYRNFAAEYDRLQQERIAALREFAADVESGAYPEHKHMVGIPDAEFEGFLKELDGE